MKFTIYGKPEPQGSTRSFLRGGKIATTSANKNLKPWRQQVSETLFVESGCQPYSGTGKEAVTMRIKFFLKKPPSVPKKREHPTVKPDLDKLVRAILDAGTGVCYRDDAQVCQIVTEKHYGDPERVEIEVEAQ